MRRWLALIMAAAALAGAARAQAPEISAGTLRRDIATLASDAFEGREPTTAGERQTLAYLIQQFSQAGLQPGYHGTWLQPTPLLASTVLDRKSTRLNSSH